MEAEPPNKNKIWEIVKTLPDGISILFGDPVSKSAAVISLFIKGSRWLIDKNKKWIETYSEKCDLKDIKTDEDSARYVQFIRKIMIDIAYETSEIKREYSKNFALNYSKMVSENKFSEVMHYQTLLSRLNEGHLRFLIFMSDFKQMSGGKEWYAPQPLDAFEMNKYANGHLIKIIDIPMNFIEPIISDLTSFGILEQRKDQNMLLLTFMGMHFVDYLVK